MEMGRWKYLVEGCSVTVWIRHRAVCFLVADVKELVECKAVFPAGLVVWFDVV